MHFGIRRKGVKKTPLSDPGAKCAVPGLVYDPLWDNFPQFEAGIAADHPPELAAPLQDA